MEIKFSDSLVFSICIFFTLLWNNVKFSEACEWPTRHPCIHAPPKIRVIWKGVTYIFILKSNSQLIKCSGNVKFQFSIRYTPACRVHGANDQPPKEKANTELFMVGRMTVVTFATFATSLYKLLTIIYNMVNHMTRLVSIKELAPCNFIAFII